MTVGTFPAVLEQRKPPRKRVRRLSTPRPPGDRAHGRRVLALSYQTGVSGADIQRIAERVGAVG
jgi:hypothetical protein